MIHQSMSGQSAQLRINEAAQKYAALISGEAWTLEHAHKMLVSGDLDIFHIGGLAKAIACFQCSDN